MGVRVKRVFDPAAEDDGERVLVDRYWPRGAQRELARVDDWCHEVAPSPELIAWYGRKLERWEEFKVRYREELSRPAAAQALERLRQRGAAGEVTLLYGSRDRERNGAVALAELLEPVTSRTTVTSLRSVRPRPKRESVAGYARAGAVPRAVLDWGWLALGLSVPLLLLAGGEAMVVYGRTGVLVVAAVIGTLCAISMGRAFLQERRTMGGLPRTSDGYTSYLAPLQDLGLAVAGYALGFAGLVLALFGAVFLGRLVP